MLRDLDRANEIQETLQEQLRQSQENEQMLAEQLKDAKQQVSETMHGDIDILNTFR